MSAYGSQFPQGLYPSRIRALRLDFTVFRLCALICLTEAQDG